MREKFNQFMQGRYGYDDLNRFLSKVFFVALILSLIGTFAGGWIPGIAVVSRVLYWIALVCLAYCYFHMFSRNIYKRSEENNRFLQRTEGVRSFFRNKKNIMEQRKYYHIYTCPGCRQKIRIPKGKGKIEVRCPKCGKTFIKRS